MSGLTFQDNLHILAKRGDNYINFQTARRDASTPIDYSAWLSAEGEYIIMEQNRSDTTNITMKYFFSKVSVEAFQDAWDDRVNKTYVEYNALFSS
jgi:hypothetical protein